MIEGIINRLLGRFRQRLSTDLEIYARRYNTIGHEFLDLESELGVINSDYKALDDLIDNVKNRIDIKPRYNRQKAIEILQIIHDVLKEKGFESQKGAILLNRCLKEKKLNCDDYSIIYLSIGEALNFPLVVAEAPQHIFIRWKFGKGYLNWETTSAEKLADGEYRTSMSISNRAIKDRIYLRDLARQEVLAYGFGNISKVWYEKGDLDKALANTDEAIRLNPKHVLAYVHRGLVWDAKG